MIGIKGAAILVIVNLILASLLGLGAGGITSLVVRRRWGLKTALVDAALAAGVAVLAAFAILSIDSARGIVVSRVWLTFAISVVSVILKHLVRPTINRAHQAGDRVPRP